MSFWFAPNIGLIRFELSQGEDNWFVNELKASRIVAIDSDEYKKEAGEKRWLGREILRADKVGRSWWDVMKQGDEERALMRNPDPTQF